MPEAVGIVGGVAQGDKAEREAGRQQAVQHGVEGAPEAKDAVAGLPELGQLVADEAEREDVEQALDKVDAAGPVDRVHGDGVQAEVDEGDEHLGGILVAGRAHAVGVEVGNE